MVMKKMKTTDNETYLGDIISSDGKNTKNINRRKNKGMALVRELSVMIVEMMLGDHHFETALMFRNAILVNSLIYNSEAWYNLTDKEVIILEQVDEMFLRIYCQPPKQHPNPFYIWNLDVFQ